MNGPRSPRVLLLRGCDGAEPDHFVAALADAGFEAACHPVLDFEFVGAARLRTLLARPGVYDALVLTSPRAAEALRRIGEPAPWRAWPTFVVGEATARVARRAGLHPVGEETGEAYDLAEAMLHHEALRDHGRPPQVLFVCGDRRRDALPDRLRAGGCVVDEAVAYRTQLRPPDIDPSRFGWAVWFSPSGVEAVWEAAHLDADAWNSLRRAAIGPTTAAALAAHGVPAHAVATAPTPEALAHALASTPFS